MNVFDKIFGVDQKKVEDAMKEKPIDSGPIRYMGGHKAYPSPSYTWIYFYEDRFLIEAYNLTVHYAKIKDIFNTNEKRRHAERLALGIILLPFALTYLWKKNHIYTIIEYDDGHDNQKIVIDFDKNVDYAQSLIYKKMLEYRDKEPHKSEGSSSNASNSRSSGSPIKF
jgi:hypothetical protein